MNEHLFSIQGLAIFLPFLFSAVLFTGGFYGHLNFKHIRIQKVSLVAGLAMIPAVAFLVPLAIDLAFDLSIDLLSIQSLFLGICFLCVVAIYMVTPKRPPNPIQIAGLAVFLAGLYYTLA